MASEQVVLEIISRESIKPSSPTPPHLRNYKLSLLDRLNGGSYVPKVFFYGTKTSSSSSNDGANFHQYSHHQLKTSLSQTLTHYYPFAGRRREEEGQVSVDCNDEGVHFLVARIHCPLAHLLSPSNLHTLQLVFPNGRLLGKDTYGGSLMVIQSSVFDCGAMAVAVCMSHELGDFCTLMAFLSHWASIARLTSDKQAINNMSPPYLISLAHPSPVSHQHPVEHRRESCVTKRFVFHGVKIAELKAVAGGTSGGGGGGGGTGVPAVQNPTAVEAVTALLYKCAISASRANSHSPSPSILSQMVNMRPKMAPPLPETSAGNFSWHFIVSTGVEELDERVSVQGLVAGLRKSKEQFLDEHAKDVSASEWLATAGKLMEEDIKLFESIPKLNVYVCSSTRNFPVYEVDFGWGKPIWSAVEFSMLKNAFYLVDLPRGDNGIEAWVTLSEEDMALFELDKDLLAFATGHGQDLLAFASFNPCVV